DAVFVAVGAWESSALGCEGDKLPGVLGGIDFLEAVARGEAPDIGQRVAIVGGGNTAMDAARTAIRLGAKSVSLLYRRTRREMPAEPLEIEEAEEEGVALHFLLAPEKVIEQNGRAAGLRLAQMALGAPDASGRRRPEPTGEVIDMPFDTIIAAIGQKVRPEGIEPLEKHRWRTIRTNPETYETSLPGVFAGGDAINDGPGIAIAAIGHGKQAAAAIDGYLQGEIIPVRKPFYVEQKGIEKEDLPEVPEVARVPLGAAPAEERVQHFNEFVPVLTAEEAQREASRCLECGCCDLYDCRLLPLLQAYHADAQGIHGRARKNAPDRSHPAIWRDENKCVLCGLCVRVCADQVGAAALAFDGRGFDTAAEPAFHWPLFDSDCISCGRCADLCPTGALQARKPFEKSPPLPTKAEEITCPHCEKGCRFTLRRYGEVVVDARPVEQAASCGIGRYAPLVKGRDWKPEQAEAIQKAMQGDLRTFEGDGAEQVIQGILGS
ncbi:MAG: FAD-dependent oxidoreductase, partial [Oscillospiraceae bacterium]|nr:FAD-dependent oxidoreductase [Oscillospiraceae bacterium]